MHPHLYFLQRGARITRAPENDQGSDQGREKPDPAAAAATLAASLAATAAAKAETERLAAKAEADRIAAESTPKPTDEEARLLKDVMKHKKAGETAAAELLAANAKLKEFEGVDMTKVRKMIADQAAADQAAAEKRGEYDRLLAEVRTQNEAALEAERAARAAINADLEKSRRTIDDLTIGSSFRGSKFLSETTVLSGDKARKLFGDHFEIEDGVTVAYDKPRGEKERTPLVDARGDKMSFEAALEKIVRGDSDFESIAKSKLRSGAGSHHNPTERSGNPGTKTTTYGRSSLVNALKKKHSA